MLKSIQCIILICLLGSSSCTRDSKKSNDTVEIVKSILFKESDILYDSTHFVVLDTLVPASWWGDGFSRLEELYYFPDSTFEIISQLSRNGDEINQIEGSRLDHSSINFLDSNLKGEFVSFSSFEIPRFAVPKKVYIYFSNITFFDNDNKAIVHIGVRFHRKRGRNNLVYLERERNGVFMVKNYFPSSSHQ